MSRVSPSRGLALGHRHSRPGPGHPPPPRIHMYSSGAATSAACEGAGCSPSAHNAHIHFELNVPGQKMSPSIFSADVMTSLHRAMSVVGERNHDCASGRECADLAYEACGQNGGMGFALSGRENPYSDEGVGCL